MKAGCPCSQVTVAAVENAFWSTSGNQSPVWSCLEATPAFSVMEAIPWEASGLTTEGEANAHNGLYQCKALEYLSSEVVATV